jgi:1-acyl-sn-glycerol-3-phosphate acyltransferase
MPPDLEQGALALPPRADGEPDGPRRRSLPEPQGSGEPSALPPPLPTTDLRTSFAPAPWAGLESIDIWRWPLPEQTRRTDRLLTRLAGVSALGRVAEVDAWDRVHPRNDPFLLVVNHSSRREVVLLTAILLLARAGRPVRFLADWNFRLVPGVGHLYARSGVITLTGKAAKPRILNRLKPWFEPPVPGHLEALQHLQRGGSVGVFPEGTVNRDGSRLLPGRRGAARLSLRAGVPVVPAGIRFERQDLRTGLVDTSSPLTIRFGEPMVPPSSPGPTPSGTAVNDWHAHLMSAVAGLCGKDWPGNPSSGRSRKPAPGFIERRSGDTPC